MCYQANCQLCPSYDKTKTDKELRAEKYESQCENREEISLKRQKQPQQLSQRVVANQNVERRDRRHDSAETACACDKR